MKKTWVIIGYKDEIECKLCTAYSRGIAEILAIAINATGLYKNIRIKD